MTACAHGVRRALMGLVLLAGVAIAAGAASAATIHLINRDGPNEGFNDPTPIDPVGGNPGTSIGAQRLFAFEYAIGIWASVLDSPVEIRVGANFNPLSCGASFVTLGLAQPVSGFFGFDGAPQADVIYPSPLADRLAGMDLDPDNDDITAEFNSTFGTTCTFPCQPDTRDCERAGWYYGVDGQATGQDSDFVTVVLHELGHGFGFLSFIDVNTGERELDMNDAFSLWLVDDRSGQSLSTMTDAERLSAITAPGHLKWDGAEVVAASGVLSNGVDESGRVDMYAPGDPEVGSSVSHWSPVLLPNELMEPIFTGPIHDVGLAGAAMADIGWATTTLPCPGDCNGDGHVIINELITGVRIALSQLDIADCPQFDLNGDGMVTVNELVVAVNRALSGC